MFVKLKRGWSVNKFDLGLAECEWLSWVPRTFLYGLYHLRYQP